MNWEQAVAWQAKQAMSWVLVNHPGELDSLPWTGRVMINLRFNIRRPASTPKKVQFPLKGADVDNLAKSVMDALQNIQLIQDDKTVTDLTATKRFEGPGHPEGCEVEVTTWLSQ